MFKTKSITAIETSVVDFHYPKDGGNESLKHAFISGIPSLAASVGFPHIKDAPRKGDVVMIPAEVLDKMLVAFARDTGIMETMPLLMPSESTFEKEIRNRLFGQPTMHAGGSLANTVDAMLYSKINGQALYDGNFVCTVGADEAGDYFKKSFEGHIVAMQGGRQMVSHIVPVDGDRIMITAPSGENPSDHHFDHDVFTRTIDQSQSLIMVGGYLCFSKVLDDILEEVNDHQKTMRAMGKAAPRIVFTLAAQSIAEIMHAEKFEEFDNLTIHGNTGEFRRHVGMDTDWRARFATNFIGMDGKILQGRELEAAKNANIDYLNAKQAANEAADKAAYSLARAKADGSLSYVVTNGRHPARVITNEGTSVRHNDMIDKSLVQSTVGAGDNHVAGYWIGKALRKRELGCLRMAAAFARAVIQIPEARLPRDAEYKSPVSGKLFQGPIAALEPAVLDTI